MKKYKISDIRNSLDEEKLEKEYNTNLIGHFIYRKISFVVTPFFLNCNISANVVTLLSLLLCIIMPLIANYGWGARYLFISLLAFSWYVLDHIDGNIARLTGSESLLGRYFDSFTGVVYIISFYTSIGLLVKEKVLFLSPIVLVATALILELFGQRSRLFYKHYLSKSVNSPFFLQRHSTDRIFTIKRLLVSVNALFPFALFFLGMVNGVSVMLSLILIGTIVSFLYVQYIIYKMLI